MPTRWNGTEVNFCTYCGKSLIIRQGVASNYAVCPDMYRWFGWKVDFRHSEYIVDLSILNRYDAVTGERIV